MKKFRHVNNILIMSCLLVWIIIGAIFVGCGKLSDDTDRPSSPVGTSGGVPLPIGPQSSLGTYTLSISSDTNTIPADNLNYAVMTAALADTSGRSLANFPVTFTADSIGNLGPTHLSTVTATTDANGQASVRFYGTTSGSCTVQASIDLDKDSVNDLYVTTVITLTSSGQPSSAGNYTLTLTASPRTIPADMATYAAIVAKLVDSTGGSVENFTITFTSDLGYLENDPDGPSSLSTTATGITDSGGSSSIYFYGARKGSAVISASVFVNDLVGTLQAKTVVLITEGPGVPGPGVPGIFLTAEPISQVVTADSTTGLGETADVTLTANIWDATGDKVGSGVRVEFSGAVVGYATTDSNGTATLTFKPGKLSVGTHEFTIKACTYGIDSAGTKYCDDVTVTVTVLAAPPVELTIEVSAMPDEIQVGSTSVITAIVSYQNQLLSGVTVGFQTNLGSLLSTTATTNQFGIATTTLQAGSTPGTATVTALASTTLPTGGQGGGHGSTEVAIISVPATLDLYLSDVAITRTGTDLTGTSLVSVKAIIRDSVGSRIEGLTVTFTLLQMQNCAGITFTPPTSVTATTNAAGVAEPTITAVATASNTSCQVNMEVVAGDLRKYDTTPDGTDTDTWFTVSAN
ncbi:hypothetical protein U27_04181 [Candidatus Vecturithrix granuli]|uniref:Big-1 domain-containing protein n=1 Tax=Vecturithrix granuli TaxID=1499967 RepID=A0A081BY11_VECG1|nr:hypothetical protein U27_04181 [Candidatus Vecturithrix granuli]